MAAPVGPLTAPQIEASPPLAMSARQVATALGCSYSNARNLIARGEIPSFKMGGLVRVRYSDLQEYVDRLATAAA